jgi:hypothetical protein
MTAASSGWRKAFAERSNDIAYLAIDAIYEPWRGDPRYRDLVRRVGRPSELSDS